MATRLPHPIPYQGSKRSLAPQIARFLPAGFDTWYEPFAGSAAMALWIARHHPPRRIVLGDCLMPLMQLWRAILDYPQATAAGYAEVWHGQRPDAAGYFNQVRERFNRERRPIDLLYLLCRCVKNAVRFNALGEFTQSVDRRRLGTQPDRMRSAIEAASALLRGRTELRPGDWLDAMGDAGPRDFAYLDPPYRGTSAGHDRRYVAGMPQERLVAGLQSLNARRLRFALSYDGRCGDVAYGPPLPDHLSMTRLSLHGGRSSQATLNGRVADTVESLYLSHALLRPILCPSLQPVQPVPSLDARP